MLITDEKIKVTLSMLEEANMTRRDQIGIPVDAIDASRGLVWKKLLVLQDEDFDKLEEYFINRKK